MRWFLIGLVILVAAAGAGAFWFMGQLDDIAAEQIALAGEEALGVPVSTSSVTVDLLAGSARVEGFTVANPAGFDGPHAARIGTVDVELDSRTVLEDVLVIRRMNLSDVDLRAQQKSGGSNLKTILDYVNSQPTDPDAPGLIIDELNVLGPNATLTILGRDISAEVPDIHLTGLGRDGEGATAGEIGRQVAGPLFRSALSELTKQGGSAAGDLLRGATDNVRERAGSALQGLLRRGRDQD